MRHLIFKRHHFNMSYFSGLYLVGEKFQKTLAQDIFCVRTELVRKILCRIIKNVEKKKGQRKKPLPFSPIAPLLKNPIFDEQNPPFQLFQIHHRTQQNAQPDLS